MRAYYHYLANVDTWAETQFARYVTVSEDGSHVFTLDLRSAFSVAQTKGILGKCHIGLVFPLKDGRYRQLASTYLAQAPECKIAIGAPSVLAGDPSNRPKRQECVARLDTNSQYTRVSPGVLVAVGAPLVGYYNSEPLYLIQLQAGAFYRDDWAVLSGQLAEKTVILGADLLEHCHFEYPTKETGDLLLRPVSNR